MKAGFFEKDVTPPVGVYLAGYPNRNEPSQGMDDPLYLRIVAMEDDDGARFVLVTADLLKFPKDMAWRTKLWCEKQLGLKSASLVINLAHTHAAPGLFTQPCYPQWPVNTEYVCFLEQSIREGIQTALADLRPATLRYGLHQAHFGVSRRVPRPELDGKVGMGPNPDGYYDSDLPLLTFHREGALKAVLYSYACHPTSKNTRNISADWPGQVSQALKRELGDDVMTLFAQGGGASIMPRMSFTRGLEEYQKYWAGVGREMAGFIRAGNLREVTPHFRTTEKEFLIPYDKTRIPSREALLEFADPQGGPVAAAIRPANRSILRLWARDQLEKERTAALPEAFRMHAARVHLDDSLQIIALSGEVTADVGRMIKNLFPGVETIFLGYCSYTDAYIPTAAMLPQGGHEALGSVYFHDRPAPFVKEIDEIIQREVLALRV